MSKQSQSSRRIQLGSPTGSALKSTTSPSDEFAFTMPSSTTLFSPSTESIRSLAPTISNKVLESKTRLKKAIKQNIPKTINLRVKNVDSKISKDKLYNLLSKYGGIVSLELIRASIDKDVEISDWYMEFPDNKAAAYAFWDTFDTFTLTRVGDKHGFMIHNNSIKQKELDKIYRVHNYTSIIKKPNSINTWLVTYSDEETALNVLNSLNNTKLGAYAIQISI